MLEQQVGQKPRTVAEEHRGTENFSWQCGCHRTESGGYRPAWNCDGWRHAAGAEAIKASGVAGDVLGRYLRFEENFWITVALRCCPQEAVSKLPQHQAAED